MFARRSSRQRERGSVYIATLGAAMMVTVIGVGGVLVTRVQHQSAEGDHHAQMARLHARSALELALLAVEEQSQWRQHFEDAGWTDWIELEQGRFRYRIESADGGALTDDPAGHVRIDAEAEVGDAVRLARLIAQPRSSVAGGNLLVNAEMERGRFRWTPAVSDDWLEFTHVHAAAGAGSLRVMNGGGTRAGIEQSVGDRLEAGAQYRMRAHLRTLSGQAEFEFVVRTRNVNGGVEHRVFSAGTATDESWHTLQRDVTVSWSGELEEAHWGVRTVSGDAQDVLIDALRLERLGLGEQLVPVPGTYERLVR